MVELTVCIGTSCHLRGAEKVLKSFQKHIKSEELGDKVDLKGTFCMGRCSGENVVVSINSEVFETSPEEADAFFLKNVAPAAK